jgi:hypothetical protein
LADEVSVLLYLVEFAKSCREWLVSQGVQSVEVVADRKYCCKTKTRPPETTWAFWAQRAVWRQHVSVVVAAICGAGSSGHLAKKTFVILWTVDLIAIEVIYTSLLIHRNSTIFLIAI